MALLLSKANRRYGALPSKPDSRDKIGIPPELKSTAPLPPKFSIETWQPPIKDQGQEGSCTAHGSSSYREFLFRKYYQYEKSKAQFPDPNAVVLSPAFIYYIERQVEGTLADGDCGAQVRTSMLVIDQYGAPLLSQEPYSDTDFSTAPTPEQIQEALLFKGGPFHRLTGVYDIKTCILSGYPIVIGFNVYDSFEGDQIAKDGLMPMPDTSTEQIVGGHEVLGGLAYDDSVQCPGASVGAVLMQNSWGTSWGIGGRFWMPYDYLNNPSFVSDEWMQHLGPAWAGKPAAKASVAK